MESETNGKDPSGAAESNRTASLKSALEYLERGFSVIPIKPGSKEPLVRWAEFQDRRATPEEVAGWFRECPDAGIAIVTGKISGIVVVDVDQKPGVDDSVKALFLPTTHTAKSGGGGRHHYYRWAHDKPAPNVKGHLKGIDIQGEGAYVVAPPSIHPSSWAYEAENGFDHLADAPEWLVNLTPHNEPPKNSLFEGVEEGRRNSSATVVIGAKLRNLPYEKWDTEGWAESMHWNEKNSPPLPQDELRVVFDSIKSREETSRLVGKGTDNVTGRAITLKELCAMKFPDTKWAIEQLLESGTINMISAPPENWKSWIALHMALCLASGRPVFDHFKTDQQAVMVVNEDDPARLLNERMKMLGADHDGQVFFRFESGFKLNDESVTKILDEMRDRGIRCIIFDTFRSIHTAEENSASEMQVIMDQLRRFTKAGHTVLLVHHNRKRQGSGSHNDNQGEEARGSTAIIGALYGQLTCRVIEEDGNDSLVITQAKIKGARKIKPFKVLISRTIGEGKGLRMSFDYDGEYQSDSQVAKKTTDGILNALKENDGLWLGVKDFVKLKTGSEKTIRQVLKALIANGKIKSENRSGLSGDQVKTPVGIGNEKLYALSQDDLG